VGLVVVVGVAGALLLTLALLGGSASLGLSGCSFGCAETKGGSWPAVSGLISNEFISKCLMPELSSWQSTKCTEEAAESLIGDEEAVALRWASRIRVVERSTVLCWASVKRSQKRRPAGWKRGQQTICPLKAK
jgi:hypothetical protein